MERGIQAPVDRYKTDLTVIVLVVELLYLFDRHSILLKDYMLLPASVLCEQ